MPTHFLCSNPPSHPTVCITGAAKGIGASCARLFAKHGYQVAICYHTSGDQAAELTKQIRQTGGTAQAFCADVSNAEQVRKMKEQILSCFGHVDVLINNAGISQQKLFMDITEDEWDHMLCVNAKSMFLCCKAFLPEMIHQKWGRIINISSIWGVCGGSCEVHYSASKAAVIGLTKALAKEQGLSGITVNCIAPGVINTDMNAHLDESALDSLKQMAAVGRIGDPEEVAQAALFFADEACGFITGQVLNVDGGFI